MTTQIDRILDDMGERPFARTWEKEEKNMRKILEKHLKPSKSVEELVEEPITTNDLEHGLNHKLEELKEEAQFEYDKMVYGQKSQQEMDMEATEECQHEYPYGDHMKGCSKCNEGCGITLKD